MPATRLRGRSGGRPTQVAPMHREFLQQLPDSRERTIAEISGMAGISRGTGYERLKRRAIAPPTTPDGVAAAGVPAVCPIVRIPTRVALAVAEGQGQHGNV